jgi:hypothetical protein
VLSCEAKPRRYAATVRSWITSPCGLSPVTISRNRVSDHVPVCFHRKLRLPMRLWVHQNHFGRRFDPCDERRWLLRDQVEHGRHGCRKDCRHLARLQVAGDQDKGSDARIYQRSPFQRPPANALILGDENPAVGSNRRQPINIFRAGWKIRRVPLDLGTAALRERLRDPFAGQVSVCKKDKPSWRLVGYAVASTTICRGLSYRTASSISVLLKR